MTSTTAQPATPAPQQSRGLILFGAVSVALISTAAAYTAMVGFGVDVLEMGTINAYAFAGVFELSLVTVALMAREAIQNSRPAHTLLTLTWMLSTASGIFAGWHEIHLGHGATGAAFRFIVPLLAALMWHLALVGDRHLATGRTWSQLRANARLAMMFRATRIAERAYHRHQLANTKRTRKELERAQKRQDRAEDRVLDLVAPADVRDAVTEWREAVVDVSTATTDVRLNESRRLLELSAPRKAPADAPAADAGPAPIALPAPAETPVAASTPIRPANAPESVTAALTASTEPVSASARPHLVTVKEPAEEKGSSATSTAPEPGPPAKRGQADTAATAELQLEAAALRADGHSVKEIARRLTAQAGRNVSERSVYRWTAGTKTKAS